ncbi:alpha/beta hydrolase [Streptomyces sp. P01-B04]|uniref:alpha/beta fold hydrolase n=1 Tax=Streptomyces poriferorum TaxID=2798799 RepID=UPI001C5D0F52|nr:alpha/beta hydrolase [Streptomyces poriferorum]MBW5251835.1 alpha/beta hydrolase [Streptomyces poriferorum]MBW5259767.1 alpha/beta hydrolase [Streptomyces poriferorum]
MSHTTPHRRSVNRALSALALLALTAGAVTACSDGNASESRHSASPEAGQTAETKLRMIDNGGHRLAFHVTQGHGSTIVLDSGGGEDSSYWDDLVPQLHAATGATVVTYDRAGLGKSDVVPGPWKVESAVSDLEAGLEQLGVTKNVTLVSHSQAGEIATYFAKENQKMLSGAVLVDANLPPLFTDAQIARLVAFSQPQVDAAKKDPENPQNRQLISTSESFVATSKAFHKATWPDAVPATVIVSEKTPFDGSPEDAQRWRDAAATFVHDGPGRTLVTAEGSSHDVPKDSPDLVLKEIEGMVAAQG